MTRPMPGPPECLPTGFPHEGAAINAPGCLLHARSYHANSKRLKDAECEKEHIMARREYDGLAEVVPYSTVIPAEVVQQLQKEEATWRRFSLAPHALEAA